MKISDSYTRIITDETLRETISHGSEEYPFCYYYEDIYQFDFHCIDWHWHSEVEFVYVKEGSAVFLVGSNRYALNAGMGIFINTQVIHRFESENSAVIPNIVFSPSLLAPKESLVYRKYINPVLDSGLDCIVFTTDVTWHTEAIKSMLKVFEVQNGNNNICEVKTVELLLNLWSIIYENTSFSLSCREYNVSARNRAELQIMMQYIHKNYYSQITLDDIAKTVSLSKSSVLVMFNKYLHTSPISYLIDYRLKRAAKLLVTTEDSVLSVAQASGFENIGYFCRRFKELFSMTPGEYRKKIK